MLAGYDDSTTEPEIVDRLLADFRKLKRFLDPWIRRWWQTVLVSQEHLGRNPNTP